MPLADRDRALQDLHASSGGGGKHRRQRASDRRALARAGLADPAVLRRRAGGWRGREVGDAGGGVRAEDVVVERAGGRAPHGAPRRRVVDEPQEHVWSADLRQGCEALRDAGGEGGHAADAGCVRAAGRDGERRAPGCGSSGRAIRATGGADAGARSGADAGAADPVGAGNGGGGCGVEEHQGTETRGRGDVLGLHAAAAVQSRDKEKKEKSGTKSGTGSVRISARDLQRKCPCTVEPYSKQKTACQVECPGSQAHHIVPDYLLGAGNRKMRERGDRLYANDGSRLTSFGDGPAICLIGNKSTQGTPHNAAHEGDSEIQSRAADNGGVLSLGEGVDISVSHALAARLECSGEILTKTYDEFRKFDPGTPIRGAKNPIGKSSATSKLLNIVKPETER